MVHQIEHQIGAYTDYPHGLGLSAVCGNYYRVLFPYAPWRLASFAANIWSIDVSGKTQVELVEFAIRAMENAFKAIAVTITL